MTLPAHRRHDISDHIWSLLEPRLPGREGSWGQVAKDNRLFINAIFWILRTGAPKAQIPPRKNRKEARKYDKALYRLRHLVENAFLHLKRWRGLATRYAKNVSSFLAIVQIRCIVLWLGIS